MISLKAIDNISELEMAIKAPGLSEMKSCSNCNMNYNKCLGLPAIVRVIEDGIQAIPSFSHFLDSETSGTGSGA